MQLLHIDSSPSGAISASRQLTAHIVRAWAQRHPEVTVMHLDLAREAPEHLGANSVRFSGDTPLTPAQHRENLVSERLLEQFLGADVIVLGAPMYNFSVPSQLKAWIDRIAQPGRTFRYTAEGPEGLAGGKTVIVASTRGGVYAGTPHEGALDHQESYLRAVFGFLGISDVRIVRAEGLSQGDTIRAAALANAQTSVPSLLASPANDTLRQAA